MLLLRKLRDFFRGFSDEDWVCMRNKIEKMRGAPPGSIHTMTDGEYRAYILFLKEMYGG